jgi:hypothetical protein
VFLLGAVSLYRVLQLLPQDADEFQEPVVFATALLSGVAVVAGALLILRPKTNYWWVVVVTASMCAANAGWSLSLYGLTWSGIQNAALWILEGCLLAFYAYHCQVPGYRWGAALKSGHSNYVHSDPTVRGINE